MKTVLRVQAAYYIATGLLPLCSMAAFERITGTKKDRWLVQMVGLLATSIGLTLGVAAQSKKVESAIPLLSTLSAMSFAGIDVAYVAKREISPVYLADAAIEGAIVASVLSTLSAQRDD